MKHFYWFWLFKLQHTLSIYWYWSRFFQWWFQYLVRRKHPVRYQDFKSFEDLEQALAYVEWREDDHRTLGDAISCPENFQKVLDTKRQNDFNTDCLPEDTLLFRDDYTYVPISDIEIGECIAGRDGRWTKVLNKFDKGTKKTIQIELSNKCTLRCTPDHVVFLEDGQECRAGSLEPGMCLEMPESLPQGTYRDPDLRLSKLKGLYIADGWAVIKSPKNKRVFIAGRDGHPKEQQKKEIAAFFDELGVKYTMPVKNIETSDPGIRDAVLPCGTRALDKQFDRLDYSEEGLLAILEGVQADATVRKDNGVVTYNTVSKRLALDIRMAFRFMGKSTSIRCLADHGGLGKNPIYRVTPRIKQRRPARVVSISEGQEERVYDIATENQGIYLPECDVVVHNCDDYSLYAMHIIDHLFEKNGGTIGSKLLLEGPQMLSCIWLDENGKQAGHNICCFKYKEDGQHWWAWVSNWYRGKIQWRVKDRQAMCKIMTGKGEFIAAQTARFKPATRKLIRDDFLDALEARFKRIGWFW